MDRGVGDFGGWLGELERENRASKGGVREKEKGWQRSEEVDGWGEGLVHGWTWEDKWRMAYR